jgi:hypothetical protein
MQEANSKGEYATKWISDNMKTGAIQMTDSEELFIATKTNTIVNADRLMDDSQ